MKEVFFWKVLDIGNAARAKSFPQHKEIKKKKGGKRTSVKHSQERK